MTYDEALNYINDFTWSSSRPGLERTTELMERLGNPQKRLKFVHVAGTNGKGSTCAMLAAVLKAAGYRVGLYPSPYLEDFRERIEINGEMITMEELAEITGLVKKQADEMEDHPSQFELITAIGMLYYVKKACDIVVLEVGMGGALDSTNVIDAPEVAVITNIGLDHTEYLGATICEIAAAKAGIIKSGSDVVVYDCEESVISVIRAACERAGDTLYTTAGLTKETAHSLSGQRFIYFGNRADAKADENEKAQTEYELSLLGKHQLKNAAVVLKTIEVLRRRGWSISENAARTGLRSVVWRARFEVLSEKPLFILDGGHNPQCAEALAENIEEYICCADGTRPENKKCVTFLIGMLADKDYRRTLEILRPYGANYVCITPDSPRALSGRRLAELIAEEAEPAVNVTAAADIPQAIDIALSCGLPTVAFGSLYSAGVIRRTYLEKHT